MKKEDRQQDLRLDMNGVAGEYLWSVCCWLGQEKQADAVEIVVEGAGMAL